MNNNDKGMLATVILNGIIWATGGVVAATAIKQTGNGKWGCHLLITPSGRNARLIRLRPESISTIQNGGLSHALPEEHHGHRRKAGA